MCRERRHEREDREEHLGEIAVYDVAVVVILDAVHEQGGVN